MDDANCVYFICNSIGILTARIYAQRLYTAVDWRLQIYLTFAKNVHDSFMHIFRASIPFNFHFVRVQIRLLIVPNEEKTPLEFKV